MVHLTLIGQKGVDEAQGEGCIILLVTTYGRLVPFPHKAWCIKEIIR